MLISDLFHAAAAPYTTVLDCVRATLRTNGVRGPFQGLGPTLLRDAPANAGACARLSACLRYHACVHVQPALSLRPCSTVGAVYLGSFEVFKRRAAESYGCATTELPAPVVLAAGGAGGTLYWLAIFPGACAVREGRGGAHPVSRPGARSLTLSTCCAHAIAVDVVKSAMMTDAIDPAQRKYPTMLSAVRVRWGLASC